MSIHFILIQTNSVQTFSESNPCLTGFMNKNPSSREAPTCANCTVFGKLWQTADRWVIHSHWPGKSLYDFPSLWHAMSSFCRKLNLASHKLQQNGDAQHCLQDADKVARSWPATWSFLQADTQYSIVSFERIPAYCREKPFPTWLHQVLFVCSYQSIKVTFILWR